MGVCFGVTVAKIEVVLLIGYINPQFLFVEECFLYGCYNSHDIFRVLDDCYEVVIFGHSFGFIDAVYFSDFFKTINADKARGAAKHITIFTKDDNSRMSILENFREIGIDVHQLFANTIITFIQTSPTAPDPHNHDNFESLAQRRRS